MQIKDLESGYYWARHNGHGSEWLAQNISWRPVEVCIANASVRVFEFLCAQSFDPELFEFGERIVKE
jgi:hypothetical protein